MRKYVYIITIILTITGIQSVQAAPSAVTVNDIVFNATTGELTGMVIEGQTYDQDEMVGARHDLAADFAVINPPNGVRRVWEVVKNGDPGPASQTVAENYSRDFNLCTGQNLDDSGRGSVARFWFDSPVTAQGGVDLVVLRRMTSTPPAITLEALDQNGNPIAGESVTLTTASPERCSETWIGDPGMQLYNVSSLDPFSAFLDLSGTAYYGGVEAYACRFTPGTEVYGVHVSTGAYWINEVFTVHKTCPTPPVGDFNGDCIVNLEDFSVFSQDWMMDFGVHKNQLPTIYIFNAADLTGTLEQIYDKKHAVYCLQGLVNRTTPRLFVLDDSRDMTWLDRLRENGGLCENWPVQYLSYDQLWTVFSSCINGLIVYDPDVISTSLAATTAAGVEGGVAVRKDISSESVYNYLTAQFPVLIDIENKFTGSGTIWQTSTSSTGSAKCDAYIWAKEKYLDTGLCDPTILMYTLDLYGLDIGQPRQISNLDYAVAKKGFCFELSPWGDEFPNDDLTQPLGTDLNTFKAILHGCNLQTNYQKMIKFCGFTNWDLKYTNYGSVGGTHGPVDTEWETASLLSAYNAYLEADAPHPNWIVNASFYAGLIPVADTRRYVQNPVPTYTDMVTRGFINSNGDVLAGNYIMIGMGDYDQASWALYSLGVDLYNDSNRGSVPCNWGINPNAIDRAYVAMDYLYRHKTEKDYFMAWDSGVGYVNPTNLYGTRVPSNYGSIMTIYQKTCRDYYRIFDYSISGWLLNGFGKGGAVDSTTVSNYAPFSGDGVGLSSEGGLSITSPSLVSNVAAICRNTDLSDLINYSSGVHFAWYRSVLKNASDMKTIQDGLNSSQHLVDAYTFYYLLRHYLGGNNNYRATWVNDTIPRIMEAGEDYSVTVTVRNDGWDSWSAANSYGLGHAIVSPGVTPTYTDYDSRGRAYIPGGTMIGTGQMVTFSFTITAPSTNGNYDLYYDMVRDGVTWFREQNNIEWKKEIIVVTNETDVDTDGDGIPDATEDADGTLYWHPYDSFDCSKTGDLNCNESVNITDLSIFVGNWL